MDWLFWVILIGGVLFVLYNILFGGNTTSKFKSDLPAPEKGFVAKVKKRKGVFALCLILSVISLALLILSLISFL